MRTEGAELDSGTDLDRLSGRALLGLHHAVVAGTVAAALTGVAFLSSTAVAAMPVQEVSQEGDFVIFAFDERQGTDLLEFVNQYNQLSGRLIHYDEADFKDAKIHQLGHAKIRRDQLDIFFGAVLRSQDFLMVRYGSEKTHFWSLRKMGNQGRGTANQQLKALARIVIPSELDQLAEDPGQLVTTSITTQYLPARDAVNTLQPYFGETFTDSIRNIEGTNTILMTGYANVLFGIHRLFKEIDVKPSNYYPKFVRRELKHAVADEIQPVLQELIDAYLGGTRTVGGASGGRRGQPQAGGGQTLPGIEPDPTVTADPRTNSLLITAGPETMPTLLSWVDQLDVEVLPTGIYVYRLKNSQAQEMADLLMETMDFNQNRSSSRGRSNNQQPGGAQGPPSGTSRSSGAGSGELPVGVVADPQSNALVISASKTRYAQILDLVQKLDVRPAQVLIQVALVEVSETLGDAIAAEITSVRLGSNDRSFFAISSWGLTDLIDTDGDGFPDSKALPDTLSQGLTGGIFDPKDFPLPFVLNSIKNTSEANVLSLPSILTNDNQEATITASDVAPFTQINQGQNSDTVSADSEDAGIVLTISPTISTGNFLNLSINLEVSAFTGASADPSLPPPSQKRTLVARVTIPDGHTMIVGGVMTNDARRDEGKIPILGDLPLIGFLFRNTSNNASKTNLYFFLTPHIISDDFSTLDELTRLHMEEAALLGGKVEMLNRFDISGQHTGTVQRLSEDLLRKVFELPVYSSVTDQDAAPPTEGKNGN